MKLALSIAIRFLRSSPAQTILIVAGIAIGIAVQVFIGSLITGLQSSLIDTTIGRTSHITITSRSQERVLNDWEPLLDELRSDTRFTAVSPTVTLPAFTVQSGRFETVVVRGFSLAAAEPIYQVSQQIVQGSIEDGSAIIGVDLGEELGITLGESITLLTGAGQRQQIPVSGLFDFKVAALNRSWVITDLALAQSFFGLTTDNSITGIETQVDQVFLAQEIADDLIPQLPADYAVDNWKTENEQLLTGLQGQSTSSLMIQVFVIIAISLGIASVLSITVIQKSRQIGILKAMGIKDGQASLVFLWQGLLLGLLGGLVGVVIGVGLIAAFTTFVRNPDGSPIVDLIISPLFLLGSGLIAVIAAMVSAASPALRSRRLDPMEVIRNG